MPQFEADKREYHLPVLFYTIFGVLNFIYVVDISIFLYLARYELALQHRGRFITCVHVVGTMFYSAATFIPLPNRTSFSCDTQYWLITLGITLWTTSLGLKFWRLLWIYELNRRRVDVEQRKQQQLRRQSHQAYEGYQSQTTSRGTISPYTPAESFSTYLSTAESTPSQAGPSSLGNPRSRSGSAANVDPFNLILSEQSSLSDELSSTEEDQIARTTPCGIKVDVCSAVLNITSRLFHRRTRIPTISQLSVLHEKTSMQQMMRRLVTLRILQPKYHIYIVAFILFFSIMSTTLIVLLSPRLSIYPGATLAECSDEWPIFLPNIAVGFFFIIIFPIIGLIIWYTTDAYGIRNEFLIQAVVGVFGMLTYLLLRYVKGPNWERARFNFPPEILTEVIRVVSHVMTVAWPVFYLLYERKQLERKRKRTSAEIAELLSKSISSNSSGFQVFMEALDNSEFLKALYRYSIREFTSENIAFLRRLRFLEQLLVRRGTTSSRSYYKHLARRLIAYENKATLHTTRLATDANRANANRANNQQVLPSNLNSTIWNRRSSAPNITPSESITDNEASDTLSNIGIHRVHTTDDSYARQRAELVRKELVKLYNEYIIPHSPNELNITSACRENITKAYMEDRLTFQSFEPVRYEVLQLIFQNTWPRMLRSELR
ncbi:hypothetical protein BDF22DRAFT_676136 [Syncephalis plumigaleata]|nr:hypothetical protein BDF22DRAFT_676136 [Syncephalis plumigaleata]